MSCLGTVTCRAWIEAPLDDVRAGGPWRQTRCFDAPGPKGSVGASGLVSFASNDYLGLSTHPAVVSASREAAPRWGAGAKASRLIVGTRPGQLGLGQ